MFILSISYIERGSFVEQHEETKRFNKLCDAYRYVSKIDFRYDIIEYKIFKQIDSYITD